MPLKCVDNVPQLNPIIRKELEIVLCLSCHYENRGDFRFCNFCGTPAANSLQMGRLLGTTTTITIPELLITARINNVHTSHLKNTGKFEARKLPVLRTFEIFLHSCSKSITTATPQDVIRFMAFKDVSDSGRTVVHDTECPHIGDTSLSVDCLPTKCMKVMAADSLRTAVIVPLKEGYRCLGISSKWDDANGTGNPADSFKVKKYHLQIKLQQLRAEVTQKQPAVILRHHHKALLRGMQVLLQDPRYSSKKHQFNIRKYRAIFSMASESTKRGDDISLLLITRVLRLPFKGGLIFNFIFGKVIRSGISEPFCLPPDTQDPDCCAVAILDEYVRFARDMGLDMCSGYLFFNIDNKLQPINGKMDSTEMSLNLKKYIKLVGLDLQQDLPVSLQSYRAGGAISKFLDGVPMQKVMSDAIWKEPKTAWKYMKILQVLKPFQSTTPVFTPEMYHVANTLPLSVQASWWQAYKCTSQNQMLDDSDSSETEEGM